MCGAELAEQQSKPGKPVYRVCSYSRVNDVLAMASAKLGTELFKGRAFASHLESIHRQIKIQLLSLNAL